MTKPFQQFAPGDRLCHRCGNRYPQTSDFWVPDARKQCGYCHPCRACRREQHRRWMAAHPGYYQDYEAAHPGQMQEREKRRRLKKALQKTENRL